MNELFNKLAGEEERFFQSQFLSPVLLGRPIRVRISGIILHLLPRPTGYNGWGIWRLATSIREGRNAKATLVRAPTLSERQAYLDLFPSLRLILCRREGEQWLGTPAGQADTRFKISGLVPIALTDNCELFQTVRCRFNGSIIWFDAADAREHLMVAFYLRKALSDGLESNKLEHLYLTQEHRDAYQIAYSDKIAADIEAKRDREEERIKAALGHAGAKYKSYIVRGDYYTIEYEVGRESHRSIVRKDNLAVESAGICLSGGDKSFDLQSLVGVIRQGQGLHRIVRVGDNQNNPEYEDEDQW